MKVIQQRCGLVDEFVAARNHLEKYCEIFSSLRRTPDTKAWVKSPNVMQESRCKGHTCARPKLSYSEWMQGHLRAIYCQIEDTSGKPLVEATMLLEQQLCWSLKLQWQNQTGDTSNIICKAESFYKLN